MIMLLSLEDVALTSLKIKFQEPVTRSITKCVCSLSESQRLIKLKEDL